MVKILELDIDVIIFGCLEVCKMGLVVFYLVDWIWYICVIFDVVKCIVNEYLLGGVKLFKNLYFKINGWKILGIKIYEW